MYVHDNADIDNDDENTKISKTYLQSFLQENTTQLQTIIRSYVAKMGLATGSQAELIAAEIFQDAALETLALASRFRPGMQPRAWFLSIAANILKRHRASQAKRSRFEVLVGSLVRRTELENEQDVLDIIMPNTQGPEQAVEENETVHELLSLVSPEDAHLLKLVLVNGWEATTLAAMMGVNPGTARVRIHRALSRLRKVWQTANQRKEQEKHHG